MRCSMRNATVATRQCSYSRDGFRERDAQPHLLRLHPEPLDKPAYLNASIKESIATLEGS